MLTPYPEIFLKQGIYCQFTNPMKPLPVNHESYSNRPNVTELGKLFERTDLSKQALKLGKEPPTKSSTPLSVLMKQIMTIWNQDSYCMRRQVVV